MSPASYFREQTNQATEREIVRELGPPLMEVPGEPGERVLIYRYAGVSGEPPEPWCVDYVLTFRAKSVLRSWRLSPCH